MPLRRLPLLLAVLAEVSFGQTAEQSRADLALLVKELPAKHVNAFARIGRVEWEQQAKKLDAAIPTLDRARIETGMQRLVAFVGDAHTDILWSDRTRAAHLPISLYWFSDGIFVLGAEEANRGLLGGRVVRIGNMTVEDACRALTPLVPHENDAQLKKRLPQMLAYAPFLYGTGVTGSPDGARIQVRLPSGQTVAAELRAVAANAMPKLARWFQGKPALYQTNQNRPYWAETIDGGATVYFHYGRCAEDPARPFAGFAAELEKMLSREGVRRLVVDLRSNPGGNSGILDPWIARIRTTPFNRKDRLFVVIGRRTFSSGLHNAVRLRRETAATFIGEPTSGKPNHFGEVRYLDLPNLGAKAYYSTKQFRIMSGDPPSLEPDIAVPFTSADFVAGADPVLARILKAPAPAADAQLTNWQAAPKAAAPQPSRLQAAYAARIERDRKAYTVQQLQEIETLYQSLAKASTSAEARAGLQTLATKYARANRTGCAILNVGLAIPGEDGDRYLKKAISEYSDSFYGNLVQVGAYARLMLARRYEAAGRSAEAVRLVAEIRRDYRDAVDPQGKPLAQWIAGAPAVRQRFAKDRSAYSAEELAEIEQLYQVANRKWNTPEARESLKQLIAKYPKSNRAGCALLYLGQSGIDEVSEGYLLTAIRDHSDAFYGDGVQVGAFARYLLARLYSATGRQQKAIVTYEELKRLHPGAIDHGGQPLSLQIPVYQ